MKIESKPVQELLDTILSLDDAMLEGAREWCTDPDTRDQMEYTVEQRKKVIDVFRLEHLTPPVPKAKRAEYLDEFERRGLDPSRGGDSHNDNVIIFQTQLYANIHRLMKTKDLSDVENDKLEWWIETYVIGDGAFSKTYLEMYYNHYPAAGWRVVQDIAEGIRDDRRRTPQQTLF